MAPFSIHLRAGWQAAALRRETGGGQGTLTKLSAHWRPDVDKV